MDTATTAIYPLSPHDALPICLISNFFLHPPPSVTVSLPPSFSLSLSSCFPSFPSSPCIPFSLSCSSPLSHSVPYPPILLSSFSLPPASLLFSMPLFPLSRPLFHLHIPPSPPSPFPYFLPNTSLLLTLSPLLLPSSLLPHSFPTTSLLLLYPLYRDVDYGKVEAKLSDLQS